ncbi:pentapeptide repeat-containing protein [Paraliomyxa miuraensis]|uniref:pentapeptide repeat-containing protein n=1 Tax=Paraliomyxa miuraensis TaxID=376150 RepID=UPI002253159D|nr:pentapeptide repeat-containing protein [Paraliomyxa miuraensis]MCX4242255.1 pentapeptide repeat-containing protein [Paraliomyxa miuraensis]
MSDHPQRRRRGLTLLHISDPQFGHHHREAHGITAADREHDTLRARLVHDLLELRDPVSQSDRGEPVRPDLVIVTGDLSEWARPSELRAFESFAAGLMDDLGLPRERLVLVPSNHDVSWAGCEAYFKQCEAEEREPAPPYWPKWRAYTELFARWYGGPHASVEFHEARPHTFYVYEELRTVVAGLNSTLPETHREGEHHGGVGEAQLRWFAEQLRPYRDRGWLRIAAVHHNVQRKAVDDDENLRDADLLERILGDEINLVLHGHTHDGKLGWLRPQVPLFATGSAAVKDHARPHGVPCQYQVLRVFGSGVRWLTRAYREGQQRWVGDCAASVDGNEWRHEHAVAFVDVHGTFPPPAEHEDAADDDDGDPPCFEPPRMPAAGHGSDDFLAQLAAIAQLREPRAEVVRRRKGTPLIEYLELRRPLGDGDQVELYPVGGLERGIDEDALEAFVQRVVKPYRRRDPGVRSVLVCCGGPIPPVLIQRARAVGVWLQSYEQYCGLIDFRTYRERLAARLTADRVYPPDKYVGQRMVERIGREEQRHDDALGTVRRWLDDEHGRFVLVLGTFGTGKTFLLRELARRLAEEDGAVVPILVEMRSLEKGLRLEQLLAQHFALHDVDDYSPARFMRMLDDGRVVLLFDGFDELVVRSTYARAAEHFETIVSAARGRAKVVVTSRRQHFLSDHQAKEAVRQVLLQKVEAVPGHRVVTLLPFEDDQIEAFLAGHLGDAELARERMRLIAEVRDLGGLSSNPRMLGFIAALTEDELRAARDRQGAVSAAGLYRTLLDRWLAFEQDRRHPPGAAPGLSIEARWQAVTELALRLWTRAEHHVGVDELEAIGAVLVELAEGSKRLGASHGAEETGFQIGSGTLLVRDEVGRFSFIHESVMEWLVARAGAAALQDGEYPELLGHGKMSQLMADFLIDLAGASAVEGWSTRVLAANVGGTTSDNALAVRQRLLAVGLVAAEPKTVDLSHRDLRGCDLSRQHLAGAKLSASDLRRANLRGTVLTTAQLDAADLEGADLSGADLRGADLSGASLVGATLLGARLDGARFDGANLSLARMIGATVDPASLAAAALTQGTAWPGDPLEPVLESGGPEARFVADLATAPDGRLTIASAQGVFMLQPEQGFITPQLGVSEADSLILSRDGLGVAVASGRYVSTFGLQLPRGCKHRLTHELPAPPAGIAFLGPGSERVLVATPGNRSQIQELRLTPEHVVTEHHGTVGRAIALNTSPDGRWIAAACSDHSLQLISPLSHDYRIDLLVLDGHRGSITALELGGRGPALASASVDGTVRVWDLWSSQQRHAWTVKDDWVTSLAFGEDPWLAAGTADGSVHVFRTDTFEHPACSTGHAAGITALAFPSATVLASGSRDGTVKLWRIPSLTLLATLAIFPEGWVAFTPDGRYKTGGRVEGRFWHVAGDCRFEVGELDDFVPGLRLSPDQPLFDRP